MINSRNKGKRGEREVCVWLNGLFEAFAPEIEQPVFRRNLMQYADGGYDIENDLGLAIEVKRHETLQVNRWWGQCVEQASATGKEPVLLWRTNRERKWHVMIRCGVAWNGVKGLAIPIEISQESFEALLIQRFKKVQ